MPKQGFTNCPECGVEVSNEKLGRHIRNVHPDKAAGHGVDAPRQTRRSKALSPRKIEMLEYRRGKENKKNAGMAVAVVVMIVLAGVVVYKWNDIFPKTHNPVVVMETSKGTIKFEIYPDKVPNTAKNFIKYADARFFDGLIFHRVANLDSANPSTHIIQTGGFDESMNQKTALYPPIDLEIDDTLTHTDGAVAMARTTDINSATSQFYICDGSEHFLDDVSVQASGSGRGYAVFGHVTSGMTVVKAIANVKVQTQGNYQNVPVNPITIDNLYIEK